MTPPTDARDRAGAGSDTMETVVALEDVTKRFGRVEALRGVTIDARRGELLAVLGPNGAGKTTAIGLMLGLRQPTGGRARLLGREPNERTARERTGAMLQESGVPGALRVRELVALFGAYYPRPLAVDDVLARAGLTDRADRAAGALSGGERQRLYFALAIVGDPDVLFLDEPTAGLDVEARLAFWDQIRALLAGGRTVILTTHYLEEAEALADRIVLLARGRVVAEGTPAEIRSRVAGKRVSFAVDVPLARELYAGLPVRELVVNGSRVSFLTAEPEQVLRRVFAVADPRDLEIRGAGLEEAFLELTRAEA